MSSIARTDLNRKQILSVFDITTYVNHHEQILVFGYIRKSKILFTENITSNSIIIPELVTILCLWYFVCFDEQIIVESFDDMNLKEKLIRGIYARGFENPSMIQKRAIIPITRYQDVIIHAQAGTGKTDAFCISALQLLDLNESQCQILMILPTKAVANHTYNKFMSLNTYLNATVEKLVSGQNMAHTVQCLSKGAQIVLGTPGRIHSMITRQYLKLNALQIVCVDEADEIFANGYSETLTDICNELESNVQMVISSSTIPDILLKFIEKYMRKPVNITFKQCELSLDGIKQYYVSVEKEQYKLETLSDLYECLNIAQCIIFVNTQSKAIWLNNKLNEMEFKCCCIYGNMEHEKRENILKEFRAGIYRILITTDLMEFGVDAHTMKYNVSLSICWDLPMDKEAYIYRVGRSGKYGRKGVVINFVTDDDVIKLRNIETFYNITINELPMNVNDLLY
eukprot:422747_1